MIKKIAISKEYLIDHYIEKNRSCDEIAKSANYNVSTIYRYLNQYNIYPLYSKYWRTFLTKEFLIKQYIEEDKTREEIAQQVGCSKSVISRALGRHSIRKKGTQEKCLPFLTKEFLTEEYINKNRTYLDIAQQLGCSITQLRYYLTKFQIRKRNQNSEYDHILTKESSKKRKDNTILFR